MTTRTVTSLTVAAEASEALALATVRPDEAERLAEDAERTARREHDWASVSVARRAAGVAAMQLRQVDAAVVRLRGAVEAATKARRQELAREAYMSLASAYILRGAPRQAFASIELALAGLHGLAAARARVQRSAILQELGHVEQALADLRVALPTLRRTGDAQWEVRALSNRSLLLVTRRLFAAAESDLRRAQRLCELHQFTLPGAYVEHNLGCVYADRGDVPAALQHFDQAADRYAKLGLEVGSLMVDRAKVLL